jgi:hypothetical protein
VKEGVPGDGGLFRLPACARGIVTMAPANAMIPRCRRAAALPMQQVTELVPRCGQRSGGKGRYVYVRGSERSGRFMQG